MQRRKKKKTEKRVAVFSPAEAHNKKKEGGCSAGFIEEVTH